MPTPKPDPVAKNRGRGRKTKTTAITPAVTDALAITEATVDIPANVPAEAHDIYRFAIVAVLARGGRAEDIEAVTLMCQHAAYARRAAAAIESDGMTPELLKIHKEQSARYMSIANEYGLTLASRLRLGLMQLAGQSVLADIDHELSIQVHV